jgi:flagellar hook-associated protein 1 FlgK
MPSIGSIYTALSGMQAQRKIMDVTAHNVSNASTPGYHRQRVELQSAGGAVGTGIFSGTSKAYGVNIIGTTQSIDELLENRSLREEAGRSATTLTDQTMVRLEGVFPEPSDTGIASQMQAFWGAWNDVANDPGGQATRTALLQNATTLTTSLHRAATDLQSITDTSAAQLDTLSKNVNDIASQIASINERIVSNPEAALDLKDQRSQLVLQLAQMTGADARPSGNAGQIDVYIGGRAIVSGKLSFTISGFGGTLTWQPDGSNVQPPSGQAATLLATINDIVPRYTTMLDDVAKNLVTQVNTVHQAGYDQNGVTGRNFFDPTKLTAATIDLSTDVAGLPSNVAAGAPQLPGNTAPGALDGEQARAISKLADGLAGPDSFYKSLVAGLAVEARAATSRADIQTQVADSTRREADSVGAVSLDEEMANLTAAQRGFEANAKVLTTVDAMLDTLMKIG